MSPFKKATSEKRSPLKARPLRQAGQSLDEEIHRIISEDVGPYGAAIVVMLVIAANEWWRWLRDLKPSPVLVSIVAVLFSVFFFVKLLSARKKLRNLKLGRDGERAVGEFLDGLRERGYRVLHDVVGGAFNVDHVLLGETGVYTIETKMVSKPKKGKAEIHYDGEKVSMNGFAPDRDPIAQAKAQAQWVRELLKDLTGKNIKIQPVVLYPGWFISKQPSDVDVWVLNPKALPAFIEHQKPVLSDIDVRETAYYLSRFVRNAEGASDSG